MATWGHSSLPVIEDGRLVGLVTRKDVDKAARHGLGHAPVTGFMARHPVTVTPDTDLPELERLLVRTGIGRLPVVEGEEVVGIVTRQGPCCARNTGRTYRGTRQSGAGATRTAARTVLASIARLPVEPRS